MSKFTKTQLIALYIGLLSQKAIQFMDSQKDLIALYIGLLSRSGKQHRRGRGKTR